MTPEVRKLLAGYASGTLSAEERAELFQAALADQDLFNALADEEGMRELLADAEVRGELLAALDEPESPAVLDERVAMAALGNVDRRSAPARSKWYVFMGLTAGICVVAALVLLRPTPEPPQQVAIALRQNEAAAEAVPAPQPARQADRGSRPAPRPASRQEPRRERAQREEAEQPPAAPRIASAPAPAAATAMAPAGPAGVGGLRMAKSSLAPYSVEQRDAAGEWRNIVAPTAGRETRLVVRFPAAGMVTVRDGEREIARMEAEAGQAVFIGVPSDEGERTLTLTQAASGFEVRAPLRFEKR